MEVHPAEISNDKAKLGSVLEAKQVPSFEIR
jgi:hypothetical protein